MASPRVPAREKPVARVLPLLGLAHLDRPFDYLVAEEQSDIARPGVRVRVRFSGRLVDAVLLQRVGSSDHSGKLRYLERVISAEAVYPDRMARLVEKLADRYGGVRSDIIRMAVPPRYAAAEEADTATAWEELGKISEADVSGWSSYRGGEAFVADVLSGARARAAWQVAPGHDWASELAALAARTAASGGGVLLVVPDQRDIARLEGALRAWVAPRQITVLGAHIGPQARYRRYLSVLHGQGRIVVGTRSAAFAPVVNLRLAALCFDEDNSLAEPRAPYPHAREVLTTRAGLEGCCLLIGNHARTAETQLLVESGWLGSLEAPRDARRTRLPLIRAVGDSDAALSRDPLARAARIPSLAFEAARGALDAGKPVLVSSPRKGYVPTLACGSCRSAARCRHCNGPLAIPPGGATAGAVPTCRWCGRPETRFRCPECGSPRLRAVVLGSERTAEELGRAFPNVPVVVSSGERVRDEVAARPALVVATPGAEPVVRGGSYGCAVLLDTWTQLYRQDLRAAERALCAWAAVTSLVAPATAGGRVVVVADPAIPTVQDLIRWDFPAAAARELSHRREVRLPPAVHLAAIDGAATAIDGVRRRLRIPHAELLGPVDLPPGVELPGDYDEARFGPPQRLIVRAPLGRRDELGVALKEVLVARVAHGEDLPLRIQIDPVTVG